MSVFKNVIGQKFGKLTVVRRLANDKYGNSTWECLCECGNLKKVSGSALRSGNTRSCGCLHKETIGNALRKQNVYDLSGDYGIGYTNNTGQQFYFDMDDYEKIKDYCWVENDQGYIVANNIKGNNPKNVRMQRLVMDFRYDVIDHKNLKRYDNRKCNLRYATKQTNGINRGVNKNNSLGIKGIYELKQSGIYQAKISKGDKTYTKNSKNLSFLIEWRQNKEKELYGEYAYSGGVR